jgi:membrane protein
VRTARRFIAELIKAIVHHRLKDMAAQMAFWSLLSLFPFCIFLLTIVGYIPLKGIEDEMLGLLHEVMPVEAWALFDRTVHEVLHRQHGVLLVVSLLAAVWSASSGMSSTLVALNRAWGVDETRPWWRIRLRSLTMIVVAAVLIVVALVALLIGPNVLRTIYDWFDLGKVSVKVWAIIRWPIIVTAMLSMLGGMYHFLPNVKRPLRLFTPGAAVAFGLWITASLLFRVYVSHFNAYAKTYGTLGAAIILLLWLYLSSVTVILGCEVNVIIERLMKKDAPSTG